VAQETEGCINWLIKDFIAGKSNKVQFQRAMRHAHTRSRMALKNHCCAKASARNMVTSADICRCRVWAPEQRPTEGAIMRKNLRCMGQLWAVVITALMVFGISPKARADLLEVDFTGVVTAGAIYQNGNLISLRGDSFQSTFIFNTDLGTLQTVNGVNELVGGGVTTPVVSASITIDGIGIGAISVRGDQGVLYWQDSATGLVVDRAISSGQGECSECNIAMFPSIGPENGTFQFDNVCPSIYGIRPCGNVSIDTAVMTDLSVPWRWPARLRCRLRRTSRVVVATAT
jgi:hypothetical protein